MKKIPSFPSYSLGTEMYAKLRLCFIGNNSKPVLRVQGGDFRLLQEHRHLLIQSYLKALAYSRFDIGLDELLKHPVGDIFSEFLYAAVLREELVKIAVRVFVHEPDCLPLLIVKSRQGGAVRKRGEGFAN